MLLKKLLFIDYFYESIPSLNKKTELYIFKKDNVFQMGFSWETLEDTSPEAIIDYLNTFKYDISVLEHLIDQTCLNHALVAKKVLNKPESTSEEFKLAKETLEIANELFPSEMIEFHEEAWKDFGKQLRKLINEDIKRSKFKIVD